MMVQLEPPPNVLKIPPALCPKCGSHRTEIVGRSADGRVLTIRCNACGERSQIDTQTMGRTMGQTQTMDADKVLVSEVEVMLQVAQALSALDADARRRVVHWVMERYDIDAARPAPIEHAPVHVSSEDDPCLAVDGLTDFFTARPADNDDLEITESPVVTSDATAADAPARQPGVESLIRGFAADFRRVALEWQGA